MVAVGETGKVVAVEASLINWHTTRLKPVLDLYFGSLPGGPPRVLMGPHALWHSSVPFPPWNGSWAL